MERRLVLKRPQRETLVVNFVSCTLQQYIYNEVNLGHTFIRKYLNKVKCIIDIMTVFQKGLNVRRFIWAWSKEIDALFYVHKEKKTWKARLYCSWICNFFLPDTFILRRKQNNEVISNNVQFVSTPYVHAHMMSCYIHNKRCAMKNMVTLSVFSFRSTGNEIFWQKLVHRYNSH